ncbi:unnamed protein product [Leptosia nina]|uniref:Uncharacterized protein n=1 Tax=Leptosia nina TaxID=320188 RepID=A0AAV1J0A3_9NEOP
MITVIVVCILIMQIRVMRANIPYEDICESQRVTRQVNSLPLVYPYGATYKLILGMSAPVKSKDYVSLAFVMNFQYQYIQFQNISQLSRYYIIKEVSREEREADILARKDERLIFYRAVAVLLEMKGMNGEDCVYRAICETAQFPVGDDGLFGEIFHVLLTPDYGRNRFDEDPDWREEMSPYLDAATAGRQMFDCSYVYHKCPEGEGVLELISALRDE